MGDTAILVVVLSMQFALLLLQLVQSIAQARMNRRLNEMKRVSGRMDALCDSYMIEEEGTMPTLIRTDGG